MKLWQTKFSQKKLSDVVFMFLVLPMMHYVSGDIACFWCWCYFSGTFLVVTKLSQPLLRQSWRRNCNICLLREYLYCDLVGDTCVDSRPLYRDLCVF